MHISTFNQHSTNLELVALQNWYNSNSENKSAFAKLFNVDVIHESLLKLNSKIDRLDESTYNTSVNKYYLNEVNTESFDTYILEQSELLKPVKGFAEEKLPSSIISVLKALSGGDTAEDMIQGGIDILGWVPFLGIYADVLNGSLYFIRATLAKGASDSARYSDYIMNGLLSFFSVLPTGKVISSGFRKMLNIVPKATRYLFSKFIFGAIPASQFAASVQATIRLGGENSKHVFKLLELFNKYFVQTISLFTKYATVAVKKLMSALDSLFPKLSTYNSVVKFKNWLINGMQSVSTRLSRVSNELSSSAEIRKILTNNPISVSDVKKGISTNTTSTLINPKTGTAYVNITGEAYKNALTMIEAGAKVTKTGDSIIIKNASSQVIIKAQDASKLLKDQVFANATPHFKNLIDKNPLEFFKLTTVSTKIGKFDNIISKFSSKYSERVLSKLIATITRLIYNYYYNHYTELAGKSNKDESDHAIAAQNFANNLTSLKMTNMFEDISVETGVHAPTVSAGNTNSMLEVFDAVTNELDQQSNRIGLPNISRVLNTSQDIQKHKDVFDAIISPQFKADLESQSLLDVNMDESNKYVKMFKDF